MRPVLYQNRPNPFKGLTSISFAIPKETFVSLLIYDASGRKVKSLIRERLKPGNYNLKWDGKDDKERDLPQGVYFYRLWAEDFKDIKKIVLIR
ncbi:MAG: FlgD immunoglobulin-like domain containing protein [candidate division WOR-3 bacterium]